MTKHRSGWGTLAVPFAAAFPMVKALRQLHLICGGNEEAGKHCHSSADFDIAVTYREALATEEVKRPEDFHGIG